MTQTLREQLDQQIDIIYDLLNHYSLPKIGHCQHHKGDSKKRCLKSLTPDDFLDLPCNNYGWYGIDGLSTEQYKAVVPRLLEILIEPDWDVQDSDRLNFEGLSDPSNNWTQIERSSITQYFILLLKYVLSDYSKSTIILCESVLKGISYWADDLTMYFKIWESQFDQLPTLRHLANAVQEFNFYDSYFFHPERWKQIKSWMSRPEIADIMIKAYIQYEDEPFADEFCHAVEAFPKDI